MQQRLETKTTLRIELSHAHGLGARNARSLKLIPIVLRMWFLLPWFDFDKTAMLYNVGISWRAARALPCSWHCSYLNS